MSRPPHPVYLALKIAPHLPERLVRAICAMAALAAWALRGKGVRRLEANLARARPGQTSREARRLSRKAMLRYFGYFAEVFTAAGIPRHVLDARVRLECDEEVRAVIAAGQRPVLPMGHLANWDYAGAWTARYLAEATTVAERLNPPELFEEYCRVRADLGITIFPAEGASLHRLVEAARRPEPGIIPIIADRDLSGRGLTVTLLGQPARVAKGPVVIALEAKVPLIPLAMYSERLTGARRRAARCRLGYVLRALPSISPRPDLPKDEELMTMTQAWVDAIGQMIAKQPEDWHMLQRVFVADLDPRKDEARRGEEK